jgi:hypothetical protein
VVIPAEYAYPNLSLLRSQGGRTFLNVVKRAITEFEKITIH